MKYTRKDKTMAKIINLEYKDEKFTLEYNRNSVKTLVDKYNCKLDSESTVDIILHLPEMFSCAFIKHHPRIKLTKINEIFDTIQDKTGLAVKLIEMINESINTLIEDGETKEGNAVWTANWD